MINTPTLVIIIVLLIIANAIPIYIFKYRKKKFGIYSLMIFITVAVTYLVYYTVPFKNSIDRKQHLYELERRDESDSNIQHSSENLFSDIKKEEISLEKHLKVLDTLLHIAGIQSIISILLCLVGLITVSGRNKYYTILLFVHGFFFSICALLEISEHLTN